MNKVKLILSISAIFVFACGVLETTVTTATPPKKEITPTITSAPVNPSSVVIKTAVPTIGRKPIVVGIPGLHTSFVALHLHPAQFRCDKDSNDAGGFYSITCNGTSDFFFKVWSKDGNRAELIVGTVRQRADIPDTTTIPIAFLSKLATISYTDATPDAAKAWVEKTIPLLGEDPSDLKEAEFGGVKFKLYRTSTSVYLDVILEIGDLPSLNRNEP